MAEINVENTDKNVEETEKTFTQTELEKIIGERLAREREKMADEFAKAKEDIETAKAEAEEANQKYADLTAETELKELRRGVAKDKGVPVELLSGKTKEECEQQAEIMLAHFKPTFSDGGEPQRRTSATPKDEFKKAFEDFMR